MAEGFEANNDADIGMREPRKLLESKPEPGMIDIKLVLPYCCNPRYINISST